MNVCVRSFHESSCTSPICCLRRRAAGAATTDATDAADEISNNWVH